MYHSENDYNDEEINDNKNVRRKSFYIFGIISLYDLIFTWLLIVICFIFADKSYININRKR